MSECAMSCYLCTHKVQNSINCHMDLAFVLRVFCCIMSGKGGRGGGGEGEGRGRRGGGGERGEEREGERGEGRGEREEGRGEGRGGEVMVYLLHLDCGLTKQGRRCRSG